MAEPDNNGTSREKVVRNVMTRGSTDADTEREKVVQSVMARGIKDLDVTRDKVVQSVMTRPEGISAAAGKYTPGTVKANAVSRYHVKIGGIDHAVFSEVNGLQLETELFEYQEGGNNGFVYKLPTITKAGNITLKRGVAVDNELMKWYMKIVSGIMDLREISVALYSTQSLKEQKPIITWTFSRAFPCKWAGPQLAAATDTVAIETVEFAHMGEIKVN